MNDYGRDENGRYLGNVQHHDERELRGETQKSIGEWCVGKFGPHEDQEYHALEAVRLAGLLSGIGGFPLKEAKVRLKQYHKLGAQIVAGEPLNLESVPTTFRETLARIVIAAYSAAHQLDYKLDKDIARQMALFRSYDRPHPAAENPKWIADADAQKGAARGE